MRQLVPLLFVALVAIPGSAVAADCLSARARATAASEARDGSAMKALYSEVAACDPSLGDWLGRRIATLEFNAAAEANPIDEARLVASLSYGRPWQTLATLGDLASDRKDHTAAARYYQEALVEMADPQRTPSAPRPDDILGVRKKAESAGLLSPTYVAMTKSRDGATTGLGAMTLRDIKITTTALPIRFEFGGTDFTTEGRKAVDDVIEMLRSRSPGAPVVLVGHTDAAGDAAFNRRLSLQRAQRVRDYLVGRGVKIPITVEGRGEDEPYIPDDATRYTDDELAQMSRRVQLMLN